MYLKISSQILQRDLMVIEPIFLNKLARELAYPLACLFEKNFHTGFVPDLWRCANITAVF